MDEKKYIEREAVMQKFADHVKRSNNSDFATVPTWNQAVQIVEDFPAADVRPVVRGKWTEHNYDPEYLSCDFSCSRCGWYLDEYYLGEGQWPGKTDHYFCPNCGADMMEEQDG